MWAENSYARLDFVFEVGDARLECLEVLVVGQFGGRFLRLEDVPPDPQRRQLDV